MSNKLYFLQAIPNTGIMQIFILIIVIVVVVLIVKMLSRNSLTKIEQDSLFNDGENLVTNKDIRLAGFELMSAGKNLLFTLIIIFGSIPLNILIIFVIKVYNNSYVNPYAVTTPIPMMEIAILIYVIIAIVALVKLIQGYQNIKRAGERLFKK